MNNEFNLSAEIQKFQATFNDLNVDTSLFETKNGKSVIIHFLENYPGFTNVLIKNSTFIPTVYPYIEFSLKSGNTLEQAFTLIAQDFQKFDV